jgi:hypothetical protein
MRCNRHCCLELLCLMRFVSNSLVSWSFPVIDSDRLSYQGVIRFRTAGRSLSHGSCFNDPASPIGHVDCDTPLFELASSDEFGTEWSKRTLAG